MASTQENCSNRLIIPQTCFQLIGHQCGCCLCLSLTLLMFMLCLCTYLNRFMLLLYLPCKMLCLKCNQTVSYLHIQQTHYTIISVHVSDHLINVSPIFTLSCLQLVFGSLSNSVHQLVLCLLKFFFFFDSCESETMRKLMAMKLKQPSSMQTLLG